MKHSKLMKSALSVVADLTAQITRQCSGAFPAGGLIKIPSRSVAEQYDLQRVDDRRLSRGVHPRHKIELFELDQLMGEIMPVDQQQFFKDLHVLFPPKPAFLPAR